MLILYKERRNKIKNKNNSTNKNIFRLQTKLEKSFISKDKKINKGIFSNSKTINYDKSNSFLIPKKIGELKDITNFINAHKHKISENNKKQLIKTENNKQYSYTFQNFYNNYPQPEPFPKKIDIRIINHNENISNNKSQNKEIYDDKKILFILSNLGLENLYSKFKDNFITYNDLKFLSKDDFVEMKIPIGPRNRIIHFIKEFNKIEKQLDFQELKLFLDEYNKIISGKIVYKKNNDNNKNRFCSNPLLFNSCNDFNINNDIINNSDINNHKKNNICQSFINDKNSYSIDDTEIKEYICNNHKKRNRNKNKENNNSSMDIDFYKTNFTYNDESIKYPSKIFDSKNDTKTPLNKFKNFYFKKPNKLIRNNTFNKINGAKNVRHKSFKMNNINLSKTFKSKLDLITKEVEKYELNYKKLKNETKRRNKNVQKILSNNLFYSKNSNFLKYKENNQSNNNSYIIYHANNKNDFE
jgi:hypothetical protein